MVTFNSSLKDTRWVENGEDEGRTTFNSSLKDTKDFLLEQLNLAMEPFNSSLKDTREELEEEERGDVFQFLIKGYVKRLEDMAQRRKLSIPH